MQYAVIFEKGEGTDWGAYIPDLPGCVAVASTREEVDRLIREAIVIHLRGMRKDGDPIPEPTTFAETSSLRRLEIKSVDVRKLVRDWCKPVSVFQDATL